MKAYWAIGMVMAAGLRAQPQYCTVNIYVEADVRMPAGMLLAGTVQATQMFREIGLNARMRNGIPKHDPSDACGAPIVVRIENAAGYRGGSNALAHAAPFRKSGTCIHVFLDRVLVYLDRGQPFLNALLAHVIVHEISHVLEGIDRHSSEGVMKATWSERDYARMRRDPLPFAPEDVDLIHRGLARRITHAAAE